MTKVGSYLKKAIVHIRRLSERAVTYSKGLQTRSLSIENHV